MPLLAYFADVAAASRLLQPQNAWKKSGNRASCRTHTHRQSTHTQAPIKPEKKGKNVARFFLWHCKAKGKRGKNFAPAVCKVFLSCGLGVCVCICVFVCVWILAVIIAFLCMRAYCECPWPWKLVTPTWYMVLKRHRREEKVAGVKRQWEREGASWWGKGAKTGAFCQ